MGEIAEMMLDGTMCQGCGEFLCDGEDGQGFPGYCESCQRQADEESGQIPSGQKPFQCSCSRRFKDQAAMAQHRVAKQCP